MSDHTNTTPRPADHHQDDQDKLAAPRRDRLGQRKTNGKTDRLMRILDSLECERKSNRRWHR